MKIPLTKPYLSQEEENAASEVIRSGWLTQGPRVAELERKLVDYIGCRDAVAVSSCTTALYLCLIAAGIGDGDEVICPAYTFIATPNSIVHAGAKPVFVDIDPATYNLDPNLIEDTITNRTKAIMPAYQGMASGTDEINEIARKHNLAVIEDAAPAIGALYKGRKVGSESFLSCFSLHPRKVITAGEGGLITTNDPETGKKLRKLRHHYMSVTDLERHKSDDLIFESYPEVGYNFRMTDIQAAIASVQIDRLEGLIVKRRELAYRYNEAFGKINWVSVPVNDENHYNTYQSYMIRLSPEAPVSRDNIMKGLMKAQIASRRGFISCHKESYYRKMYPDLTLKNSEYCTDNCIILPLFPAMTRREQDYVIENFKRIASESTVDTPALAGSLR
ncbi:MAG: aminotransferase class I/II-fold pyridoxal phosphate-dependent enzyme [candidate division Zixibacteria bacterium]|nr:aminotransferase class I/II-fold pyridoxal phosphate-dependent enzyme [candidate division Zixibacteria bacterium]